MSLKSQRRWQLERLEAREVPAARIIAQPILFDTVSARIGPIIDVAPSARILAGPILDVRASARIGPIIDTSPVSQVVIATPDHWHASEMRFSSGGDRPMESLSLNFTKILLT